MLIAIAYAYQKEAGIKKTRQGDTLAGGE